MDPTYQLPAKQIQDLKLDHMLLLKTNLIKNLMLSSLKRRSIVKPVVRILVGVNVAIQMTN